MELDSRISIRFPAICVWRPFRRQRGPRFQQSSGWSPIRCTSSLFPWTLCRQQSAPLRTKTRPWSGSLSKNNSASFAQRTGRRTKPVALALSRAWLQTPCATAAVAIGRSGSNGRAVRAISQSSPALLLSALDEVLEAFELDQEILLARIPGHPRSRTCRQPFHSRGRSEDRRPVRSGGRTARHEERLCAYRQTGGGRCRGSQACWRHEGTARRHRTAGERAARENPAIANGACCASLSAFSAARS